MKVICITGIDGAGKTTLAKKVVQHLQDNGLAARYIYGRTFPTISRLIIRFGQKAILKKHDQWNEYPDYHAQKKSIMRNPFLRGTYTFFILLDYYFQIWFKLLPHIASREWIILDRYIYDTVINDLAVHLGFSHEKAKKMIYQGMRLMPHPQKTFLIDLPAEVAFARKNDMPHIDYLTERQSFYLDLCSFPEVTTIDGSQPKEKVLQDLLTGMRELTARGAL